MAQSKWWWVVVLVGVLLVLAGFSYWMWPAIGYAVASNIFGWLVIMCGIIFLCVASGPDHPRAWGWWVAGGVIDLFVGFMLVRNVFLAESVLPWFLALLFIYWGVEAFIGAGYRRKKGYWWLDIINGVLLCAIGFFFCEAGYLSNMWMVTFLTSIGFIYWGFTLSITGYAMRPLPDAK